MSDPSARTPSLATQPTEPGQRCAVKAVGLGYRFAGAASFALEGINLALPEGSWTLVAGPTGSGKSTLLRAISGLIPHHAAGEMQGEVSLFGVPTRQTPPAWLAATVGVVLQSPDDQLCTSTVEAEVAFGLENLAIPASEIGPLIEEALARVGLVGLRRRSTTRLSGGQKQRLILASVLAMRPRLLVLDEPLRQLDAVAARELLDLLITLHRDGLTIVMAEHRLDEVLLCAQHLIVVDDGRLVSQARTSEPVRVVETLAAANLRPPAVAELARRCGLPISFVPIAVATDLRRSMASAVQREKPTEGQTSTSDGLVVVQCEGVSAGYAGERSRVFSDLDLSLRRGQRVAVVGGNGAGKSTLLALLAGLIDPARGRVTLAESVAVRPTGMVTQNPDLLLFSRSVAEELMFGPLRHGATPSEARGRAQDLARRLALDGEWDRPPLALSQGMRLRTALAAVLTARPGLLLLDEPTTGQDEQHVETIMELVTEWVRDGLVEAAVFSTHDLATVVRYADRVIVLADGRLQADVSPRQLLDSDELMAMARLRLTPLLSLTRELGLAGTTPEACVQELVP